MTSAQPAREEFAFDEATHTYTLNGIVLPSVTQVLEDVGLIDYSFIPGSMRDVYLRRGSAVHLATAYDDVGDLDEESLKPELRGYLEAWRKFRADSRFTWDRIEYQRFHRQYGYAGTLDRQGSVDARMNTRTVVDIKTGHAPTWVRYQLAAYAGLYEKPIGWRRMAVELHDDGTYGVTEFPCREFLSDFQVFLAALTVFSAKRRK